jgi:hypothetical protein
MNRYGVLFGLFIIAMGFLTLEPSLDKEPHDMVSIRYGVMVEAASARLWGIIVILLGFFILIFSTLVP